LVAAAGLDGYSEVEFRRDAEGVPRLMEINSRLSASIEIAVRAGIDFPLLLYLWAAGEPVPEARTYQVGMRMRWLGGDLRSLRETLATQGRPDVTPAARAVAAFAADFFRRAGYDYVSASDPLPMLVATRMFVSDAVGSLRSHGSESRPPVAADARGFM
jgi:predicted ATP-grasp superfamily ATP-dependent carboligase